jgi:hypothetical protein
MANVGSYGNLELDDKQALAAVKSLGGWKSLCHTTRDKMGFKQQEFIKMYQAFENTPPELLPKSLLGIDDLSKNRLNFSKPKSAIEILPEILKDQEE